MEAISEALSILAATLSPPLLDEEAPAFAGADSTLCTSCPATLFMFCAAGREEGSSRAEVMSVPGAGGVRMEWD